MNLSKPILKAYLSRLPKERRSRLESFLSEKERELLKRLPDIQAPSILSTESLVEQVHWSWFLPTLKTFSIKEQRLIVSAIGAPHETSLIKELDLTLEEEPLTNGAKIYLKSLLENSLLGTVPELLPPAFLPPSQLNTLLDLPRKAFLALIDLLSLYDLALEFKQIVETKILQKLYSVIPEHRMKFLKKFQAESNPPLFPRLHLERFAGSEEELKHILHKRGVVRLGSALADQDPSLIWHVAHRLDIGRGGLLLSEKTPAKLAAQQVTYLLTHPEALV